MRICIITSAPLPPSEGVGFHVWNLAVRLRQKGHAVGIVTRGWAQPTVEEWAQGVRVWHTPFIPTYPLHVHVHAMFVNALLRHVAGEFDLVHAHTPLVSPTDCQLPIVTTVHSPMATDTAATHVHDVRSLLVHLQTPVSRRIERSLFERSSRITAVADWVADALGGYGVAADDVAVTGNGVEERFLEAEPAGTTRGYVLFVGRIEEGKGLLDLIEAAKLVEQSHIHEQVRYVIVGDGPLLPTLKERLAGTPLAERFSFTGQIDSRNRDKLLHIYQQAKVFVLPSHHEGMPTVLLEAMACGLPVVACAVGGCREVIHDDENGMLVRARQPEEIARAILLLMEDKERRQTLAIAARATIQTRFSWDSVVERYCSCYERTLLERG